MNAKEAKKYIMKAVAAALDSFKLELEAGECCPFCGRKKGSRNRTERLISTARENLLKAHEARRKKK